MLSHWALHPLLFLAFYSSASSEGSHNSPHAKNHLSFSLSWATLNFSPCPRQLSAVRGGKNPSTASPVVWLKDSPLEEASPIIPVGLIDWQGHCELPAGWTNTWIHLRGWNMDQPDSLGPISRGRVIREANSCLVLAMAVPRTVQLKQMSKVTFQA